MIAIILRVLLAGSVLTVGSVVTVAAVTGEPELGAQQTQEDNGEPEELPDDASDVAKEKRAAALAFRDAMRTWGACVGPAAQEHAASQGEGSDETPEGSDETPFDPEQACGDRPNPHDSGLTGPPESAGPPEGARGDDPEENEVEVEDETDEDAGRPDDVPPVDVPTGRP